MVSPYLHASWSGFLVSNRSELPPIHGVDYKMEKPSDELSNYNVSPKGVSG